MKKLLPLVLWVVAAASARAQERPDLASDLWYRATAPGDARWAGFAHIRLENGVEDGRAVVNYFEEGELEFAGAATGWREEWTLDADLAPVRGMSRLRVGGAEVQVAAKFDGRTLVRRAVAPAVERVQPWTRERACWPARLVPAALLRRYGPWHPALEMSASSFTARADGGEAAIGEEEWGFVIKNRGPRPVADLEQDCWTLEGTPRAGAGATVTLVVDARGLPVEFSAAGCALKRARDEKDAKGGREFVWAQAGRRDPFRPMLTELEVRRIEEGAPEATRLTAVEVRALLDEARAHLEAMQAAAGLPEADRERALAENSRAIRVAAGKLRDSGVAGSAARVAEIVAAAGRLFDPSRAAVSTAKALFKEIREAFEAGDAASLARVAPLMGAIHELSSDPELAGRPELASVRAIEEEAAGLDRRAAIRLEGLERLRDRHPNGVMVVRNPKDFALEIGLDVPGAPLVARPKVTLRVASAVALLGDKSFPEGSAIDGAEGCVLKEILPDAVVIEYRGEKIRMRIGE
ncbi:MAG: general secretion pathway protein GspB [Planctomycetes bacterium]|nr:general secretion pathway protein GspB [Planctomycetota bacterium]